MKRFYMEPAVEVLEMEVEQGFTLSSGVVPDEGQTDGGEVGGDGGWN